MLYPIDLDNASDAYQKTARRAAEALERASMINTLADHLSGAFVNCKLAEKAAPLFPRHDVRYIKYVSGAKSLYLIGKEDDKRLSLPLARKDDKRVSADFLRAEAKRERETADHLQMALAEFWEYVGQYNIIVKEYEKIRGKISDVLYYGNYTKF